MQTVSGSWAANIAASVRTVVHGEQISWPASIISSIFFKIGTSLIGGPDILKSGGSSVAFFDRYQFTDYSHYAMSWQVQRKLGQYPYGTIMAQADVQNDNSSNLFTPGYDPTIGSYVGLPNRPLKLSVGFGTELLQQFIGFTDVPEISRQSRTQTLHAYDVFNFINGFESSLGMQVSLRADQIIAAALAEMGFSASQYSLDISLQPAIGFLAPNGLKWGDIFQQLCEAEQALMFADENGIIQFWNRQHFLTTGATAHSLTFSNMLDFETQATGIFNNVIVTAKPRAVQANQKVSELQAATLLSPSTTTDVFVDFADDDGALPVSGVDTPASGGSTSFYTANTASDGSGADMTGSVSVSSSFLFGTSYRVTFSNSSGSSVYLTALTLYGTPAKVVNVITETYSDATSIADYGLNPGNNFQPLTIDNDYIQNSSQANSLAYTLVHEYKDPHARYTAPIFTNPALQIGDKVDVKLISNGSALDLTGGGTAHNAAPTGTPQGNHVLTWSVWFETSAATGAKHCIASVQHNYLFYVNTSGQLEVDGNSGGVIINSGVVVNDGVWHNAVYIWDGTHSTVYLDGVQAAQNTTAPSSTTLNNISFGTFDGSGGDQFNGQIDASYIWSTALKAADVTNIFGLAPPLANGSLVNAWLFSEGTGTTSADSKGANTMTLAGAAAWATPGAYPAYAHKTMYLTGYTTSLSQNATLQQTIELEERNIQSYFTINVSTIGGTDGIAP